MKIKFEDMNRLEIAITEVDGNETLQIVPKKIPSTDPLLMFEKECIQESLVIFPLFTEYILGKEPLDPKTCIFKNNKFFKMYNFNFKFKHVDEYIMDTWNFLYFEKIDNLWQLAGAATQLEIFSYGALQSLGAELEVPVKKPIANLERVSSGIYKAMPTNYFCGKYHYKKPEEPFVDKIADIEEFFDKF